jgi:hypothetical protein
MESLAPPILSYGVWLLAIVTVTSLWIVAMVDIKSHESKEIFTAAQLASMVAAISLMAMVTVVAVSAAFPASWAEIASSEAYRGVFARPECKGIRGTFIFSFGLEQPSYAASECPASPTRSSAM